MFGQTLSTMSQRDVEEGGMRHYARKGMIFGEQDDYGDGDRECFGCYDGCLECDPDVPAERITESDIHPSQHWSPDDDPEGYGDWLETIFDPDL